MTNKELIEKCKKYQKLSKFRQNLKRNLSERKLMKWKLIFTVLVIR